MIRLCFALVVMTATVFSPLEAAACSCEPSPPPLEALARSVAVFSGAVVAIEDWATANDGPFLKVTFEVTERWEGGLAEVAVVTASDDARCGFRFEMGQSYLVYAYGYREESERLPATGVCTRTRTLETAEADLVDLRRPTQVAGTVWGRIKSGVALLLGGSAVRWPP